MGARERVRRVLAAAARLADPADSLHHEALTRLPAETGLPAAHIARALARCVERSATDEQLTALCASVPLAPRAHVVLSSNVFVAPVRALALAWASASDIQVRPSRRAPVIPELLARALREQENTVGSFALVPSLDVAPGEVVHAYGSDETIAALRATLPPGARLWGHGHGFGVALAEPSMNEPTTLALAHDVALFDQRGCLSPRLVLCVGDERASEAWSAQLHRALERAAELLPLGHIDRAEQAARQDYVATMEAVGSVFPGPTAVVGHQHRPDAVRLPSFTRGVHVVSAPTLDEAAALLAPLARWVTCVSGSGNMLETLATVAPRARRAGLGRAQNPPLDGPVDLRVDPP